MLVKLMTFAPARWLGVRLVAVLAHATRVPGALRAAGAVAAAVTVADDLQAGRCAWFRHAAPQLISSWERDLRAQGLWPPPEQPAPKR